MQAMWILELYQALPLLIAVEQYSQSLFFVVMAARARWVREL